MAGVWFTVAGASAFLAVAAGAFGAHALRGALPADLANVYETAARYHLMHALAMLCVGVIELRRPHTLLTVSNWCFLAGTVLFSGSLYALSLSGVRWLGAITPFGGVAFLIGWLALAWFGTTLPPKRRF